MTRIEVTVGCCAIVLAAGHAVRFGSNKLVAPFRGAPLLAHPLRILGTARAKGLIARTIAVIQPDNPGLADLVRSSGAEPVFQPDALAAQGSSLRLGLRAALGNASALVVLGDQPLLRLEAIQQIVATAALHPDAVVRAWYTEAPATPGHPVLVPARWWHLAASDGGFRRAAEAGATEVAVRLGGRNPDVDTPDDLHTVADGPD